MPSIRPILFCSRVSMNSAGGDKIAFHESQMDWNMKLAIDLVLRG